MKRWGGIILEIKVAKGEGKEVKLRLASYGHESCSSDKKCVNKRPPRFIMHFVIYGKGVLRYAREKECELSKGDVFLLYADELYSYEPDRKDPWTYAWVTIDGEELEELFSQCGFTKEKPYLRMNDFSSVVSDIKKLTDAYGADVGYDFERTAYLLLIISKMIQQNRKNKNIEELKLEKRRSFRLAVSYIRDNYMLDLDVYNIASAAFLSESYLKHLFKEMTGMSVTEFLNRYRISKACGIFNRAADMSDIQVAKEVGYDNYTYFVRLFTKYCAVSPREYKKLEKQTDPFAWIRDIMLMVFDEEEIDWL